MKRRRRKKMCILNRKNLLLKSCIYFSFDSLSFFFFFLSFFLSLSLSFFLFRNYYFVSTQSLLSFLNDNFSLLLHLISINSPLPLFVYPTPNLSIYFAFHFLLSNFPTLQLCNFGPPTPHPLDLRTTKILFLVLVFL